MSVKLNFRQTSTLASAIAWCLHPKNPDPAATQSVIDDIRSGWLREDELLDQVKRGFDLSLRSYA